MSTISRQFGLANPTPVPVTPVALADAAFSALPRAPLPAAGFPRPFGDTGLTSRCPVGLPSGAWKEAWSAALDENSPPAFVTVAGDRIVTQGGGFWHLFDANGRRVAAERTGAGPVFLDTVRDRLFYLDRNDYLNAVRQRDGKFEYRVPIPFGDLFAKPLLASAGDELVVVAVEQEGLPHRPAPPDQSAIQVIGTGKPLAFFRDGTLSSISRDEKLLIGSAGLLATLHNGRLIAAWPDRLLFTGLDLKVRSMHQGRFRPGLMAGDEAGRAYIVLADERGERALWVISESGQRLLSVALPVDLGTLFFPPIIGFDHQMFVLTRSRLLALGPAGERLWLGAAQTEFAGASVLADGQLIAADGKEVVAFARNGSRRVLAQLPGPILTPPIVGTDQLLLVARAGRLHAFRPQ